MLKLTEEAEEARPEERGKGETPQADGWVASHQRMAVSLGLKGGFVTTWTLHITEAKTISTTRLTAEQVSESLTNLLIQGADIKSVTVSPIWIMAELDGRFHVYVQRR